MQKETKLNCGNPKIEHDNIIGGANQMIMTQKEIGNHIRQFILPAHSSYHVDKAVLYKRFGDDLYIKGYSFSSGGKIPTALHVTYFIMPLFLESDTIAYTFADELYYAYREGLFNLKRSKNRVWDVRKASQDDAFKLINTAMDEQGEPVLAKFETARDVYDAQKRDMKDNTRVYEACAYSTILFADQGLQDKMLKGLIRETKNRPAHDYIVLIRERTELLLSKSTREERIGLLKAFANETISNLKMAQLKPFT